MIVRHLITSVATIAFCFHASYALPPTESPSLAPTEKPSEVPTAVPTAPTSLPSSMPSNLIQNEDLIDQFTTDLLTATLSGSISAVEKVINEQGLAEATKNNQAYSSLVSAIYHGRASQAEVILSKTEIDINAAGITGNTALMFASMWGQQDSVQFLLDAGADSQLTNNDGDNAVALALKGGHRSVVRLLRDYGAE